MSFPLTVSRRFAGKPLVGGSPKFRKEIHRLAQRRRTAQWTQSQPCVLQYSNRLVRAFCMTVGLTTDRSSRKSLRPSLRDLATTLNARRRWCWVAGSEWVIDQLARLFEEPGRTLRCPFGFVGRAASGAFFAVLDFGLAFGGACCSADRSLPGFASR